MSGNRGASTGSNSRVNPVLPNAWNTFTRSVGAGNRTGITGPRPNTRPSAPAPASRGPLRVPPVSAGSRQPAGYRANPDLLIRTHASQYPSAPVSDRTTQPGYSPVLRGRNSDYPGASAPARSNPPAAPARPSAPGRSWAAPAATAGGAAAVVTGGTPMIRTSGRESMESQKNAMLQNAGMPPLHQIEPLAQPSPYSQVGSAGQGRMLSQFQSPSAQPLADAWSPGAADTVSWGGPTTGESRPFLGKDVTGGIRAVPMDDTQYQTLSVQGDAAAASQFAQPSDFGVNAQVVRPDASEQNMMREAFRTPASRAATVTAFQGDNPAPAQAGTKAPVQGGLDLSRVPRDRPDLLQWAEANQFAAAGLDGKNIVQRYLDKLPPAAPAAESTEMPSNTPEAQNLMQDSFKSGSPDLGTSMTDAPATESFAQSFRRRNEDRITQAFGGNFSPGFDMALKNAPSLW